MMHIGNKDDYGNWIRSSNGLILLKDGIAPFAEVEAQKIFQRISHGVCRGAHTVRQIHACTVCTLWEKNILALKKRDINWSNSKPKLFTANHWELAKLFMGRGQQVPGKTSAMNSDCSALLQLMTNNNHFTQLLGKDACKLMSQAIESRNHIMHSPNLQVTDQQFQKYIDCYIAILNIPVINKSPDAAAAVERLLKLKEPGFDFRSIDGVGYSAEMRAVKGRLDEIQHLISQGQQNDVSNDELEAMKVSLKQLLAGNADLKRCLEQTFDGMSSLLATATEPINEKLDALHNDVKQLREDLSAGDQAGNTGEATDVALQTFDGEVNYVTSLNQLMQDRGWSDVNYRKETTVSGHKFSVTVEGETFVGEQKSTKNIAKRHAAFLAIKNHAIRQKMEDLKLQSSYVEETVPTRSSARSNSTTQAFLPPTQEPYVQVAAEDEIRRKLNAVGITFISLDVKRVNGTLNGEITCAADNLWSSTEPVLGKAKAEQTLANKICHALGVSIDVSAKQALKVYGDRNKMAQPKYLTYANPCNLQEFYAVAWFAGERKASSPCVLKVDGAGSTSENCMQAAIAFTDTLLQYFAEELSARHKHDAGGADGVAAGSTCGQQSFDNNGDVAQSTRQNPVTSSQSDAAMLASDASTATPATSSSTAESSTDFVSELNQFCQKQKLEKPESTFSENGNKEFQCTMRYQVKIAVAGVLQFPSSKEAEKQVAKQALVSHFPEAAAELPVTASKNRLQEMCSKAKVPLPTYDTKKQDGGFTSTVKFLCVKSCTGGFHESKAKAKQDTARRALQALNDMTLV